MKDSAIAANDALSSSCIAVCSSPQYMPKLDENNEKVEASTNFAPNTINLQRSPTFSPTVSGISANTGVMPNHLGLLNSDEQNREITRQNTFQTNTYPSTRVAPACCRRTQRYSLCQNESYDLFICYPFILILNLSRLKNNACVPDSLS